MPNIRHDLQIARFKRKPWLSAFLLCRLIGIEHKKTMWDAITYEIRHFKYVENKDYFKKRLRKTINGRTKEYYFDLQTAAIFTMRKVTKKRKSSCLLVLNLIYQIKGGML